MDGACSMHLRLAECIQHFSKKTETIGLDWVITLDCILKKEGVRMWIFLAQDIDSAWGCDNSRELPNPL
jgi:hypothetical protein